jgi:hypothetical protein
MASNIRTTRHRSFAWPTLTFIDRQSVRYGVLGMFSLSGNPHERDLIQTEDDLREAQAQNPEHANTKARN